MNPTQIARQTTLAEYLSIAMEAFLTRHPDTELETVRRAIQDAATDADVIYERVMK
jgi:hypothetical protein